MRDDHSAPERTISHADAIKGLTHPIRIRLLDALRVHGDLTATQCAALVGESVASCSFHLRQLEKYGHVVRAEQRGKERPWTLASRGYSVRPEAADEIALGAAQEFGAVWLTEQFARLQGWVADAGSDDPEWVQAAVQTSVEVWATREELEEFSREVVRLARSLRERATGDDARPEGARRVQFFGAVWPNSGGDPQEGAAS